MAESSIHFNWDDFQEQIDDALDPAPNRIFLTHDQLALLEDEVWRDFLDSVEAGERTLDEATAAFIEWREAYIDPGIK